MSQETASEVDTWVPSEDLQYIVAVVLLSGALFDISNANIMSASLFVVLSLAAIPELREAVLGDVSLPPILLLVAYGIYLIFVGGVVFLAVSFFIVS
jgi:hypothetical protein